MVDELKTYLSVTPNRFQIFLYDTKKLINLYKQSIKFDNQSEEINYISLNKFLEENIFKVEKLSGNFINNVCLIINNNKVNNISLSIKDKNYNKILDKKYIQKLLTNAKDIFTENYPEEKILHILLNGLVVDKKFFSSFQDNLNGDKISIEVQFKSISIKLLKEIDNILERYQIKVSDCIDQNYLKSLSESENFELDEIAHKVQSGFNDNEVKLIPKNQKKKGFFERFFQLFS
ncbi:hypothetical protein [Candidatus Pelagibacter sp.]|uniref:hypothetical protein n=1 Tax=Candidatus Pelagibacter sp. TaxID=2024849 RepID=UPI003F847CEC